MTLVTITQIPTFNSVVIKQSGGNFFIAAKDSIIIDKDGLIQLITYLGKVGFITPLDLVRIMNDVYPVPEWVGLDDESEGKDNG